MTAKRLAPRLVATARVVAALPRARRTPFRPAAEVGEIRDARLRAVVRHAAETVPYYRDLFRERKIDPAEIRGTEDLPELPLLDKETVQRAPDRFRSTSAEDARAVPFPTSGSSGTPLIVWHEPAALLRYLSTGERQRGVVSRLLGTRSYRTLSIGHSNSTGKRARAFYRRATFLPARRRRRGLLTEAPLEAVVETVNSERPDVLSGYGHYLEWLFRLLATGAIRMRLPRLVHYYGSSMTAAARRLIEEDLGVPVVSTYAAVETFGIGFFCEERAGFHLHDDVCHLRVASEDGADAPAGELGEVVVSNLVNPAMVLLNYRLGDVGTLLGEPCACGRTFSVLASLEGRVDEIVHLRSGRLVHPGTLSAILRVDGLLRFQLLQETRNRFRLEVVTTDDASYAQLVRTVRPKVRSLLEGAEVEVVRRDAIDGTPDRKLRRVVALPVHGHP